MAYVGNAPRQVEGLSGQQDGARAAGNDGPLVLTGARLFDARGRTTHTMARASPRLGARPASPSPTSASSLVPSATPPGAITAMVSRLCRKRSFATDGRGRLPASAVVPARDEQGWTAHRPQILLVERLLEQGVRAARHWVRRRGLAGVGEPRIGAAAGATIRPPPRPRRSAPAWASGAGVPRRRGPRRGCAAPPWDRDGAPPRWRIIQGGHEPDARR